MEIKIEFRYGPNDMPEAAEVAWKHMHQGRSIRIWRGIAGWLLIVALTSAVVVNLQRNKHRRRLGAGTASSWITSEELGSIAGAAVGLFLVCTVTFACTEWMRRRAARNLVSLEMQQSLVVDDKGLIWTQPDMITEHRWSGIRGWRETANLFVLFKKEPGKGRKVTILVIPRRAFISAEQLQEFLVILEAHAPAIPR